MTIMRRLSYGGLFTLSLVLMLGNEELNAFQVTPTSRNVQSTSVGRFAAATSRRLSLLRQSVEERNGEDNVNRHRHGVMTLPSVSGGEVDRRFIDRLRDFASKNFFVLGMVVAVSLARAFPSLGKNGGTLRPELFIGQYGVTLIFLLSGLSLELSELKEAASNLELNGAIQLITFCAWPFLVGLPLTNALGKFVPNLVPPALLDGLLILTCLPTTVNMCFLLTSAAGGSVASSLCNAVISNLAGIFVTPALLLLFFGTEIHLPFVDMVIKLCNMVLLPVGVGQALRATRVKSFYTSHSKKFKRLQEIILLGIVYNAFCNAFTKGLGLQLRHALVLLMILPTLHLGSLAAMKALFERPMWNLTRGEVVAAMFCTSQKTLAFGLPLVNTIFDGNPNLASYCAPIMFIHPLQLVLGSLLVPRLRQYTNADAKK